MLSKRGSKLKGPNKIPCPFSIFFCTAYEKKLTALISEELLTVDTSDQKIENPKLKLEPLSKMSYEATEKWDWLIKKKNTKHGNFHICVKANIYLSLSVLF